MFVAEGAVLGNSKVHWLGIVNQFSSIPAGIQLSACIPVLKMKSIHRVHQYGITSLYRRIVRRKI